MNRRGISVFGGWLTLIALLVWSAATTPYTADMSAFLPAFPSQSQRLLIDQLQEGVASRLILVGIEGGDAPARMAASRRLAEALSHDSRFVQVENGAPKDRKADERLLFENRYALSPKVDAERFSIDGLHQALQDSIGLLSSSAGLFLQPLIRRDPTGEMLAILNTLERRQTPPTAGGVWVSKDGQTALLLALSSATCGDLDAQEAALNAIRAAFEQAIKGIADAPRLVLSGPAVFSVEARATIKTEVARIAAVGTGLLIVLLLLIYRSLPLLLLGLVPVLTGALAGIAAVRLGFGTVHGLTLGFGTTLMGEAVDYAIYFFLQRGDNPRFWATIRLGLMTSACGFLTLFASSFPGLAQIGLYSLTGLVAAALTTRYILPAWLPPGFAPAGSPRFGRWLARLVALAPRWRWLPIVCATLGALALWLAPQKLWQNELLALSPVPAAAISEDARLRGELAAPDARHLIVVLADNDEAALAASTALSPLLADLQARQKLAGWDSPANYLPDIATQKQRLTSIPEGGELIRRLKLAAQGLPLSADKLTPFVQDAQAARVRPPLTRKDLTGTSLALALDALLFEAEGRAVALLPLVAPLDERALGQALDVWQRTHPATQALLIDTKAESDAIYADYLAEILRLTGIGVAVILLLLGLSLKSAKKALRVALPITAAVLTVLGGLMLAGQSLILLHLIGLMLIVAIGSNYALFFTDKDEITPQTSASIAFACATTVAGFTPLAFSFVPILQAIGITVAPGALLALVFSAMLAGRRRPT